MKRQAIAVLCTELASVRSITSALGRLIEPIWVQDLTGLISAVTDPDRTVLAALVDHSTTSNNPAIDQLHAVRNATQSVRRILLTDYCDLGIIVQGLHTRAVQAIVYKPIHAPELLAAIGMSHLPTAINAPALRAAGLPPAQVRAVG